MGIVKEKKFAVKVIPVGEDAHFSDKFPIYVAVNGKEVLIVPNTKVYLSRPQILALEGAIVIMPARRGQSEVVQPRFIVQELHEEENETKSIAKESDKLPVKKETDKSPTK